MSKQIQYAQALYEALEIAAGKEQEVLSEFTALLARQNDVHLARQIMDEFVEYFNKQQGIIPVLVQSARELDSAQMVSVEQQMKTIMPDKRFEISTTVDKNLIGGIKIQFDNRVFDATVRRKLNMLVM